ncbi:MAG: hypothetical protein ACOZHQ_00690 [Thermodesulfobacteriota bacterium]
MAVLLALACLLISAAAPAPARLTSVEGAAWLMPPGGNWSELSLAAGQTRDLPAGSLLRTGEKGRLELELGRGQGRLRLEPSSELVLRGPDAAAPHGSLYLEIGRLRAKLADEAPVLKAPAGELAAGPAELEWRSEDRGGRALLRVDAGQARLSGGGQAIALAAGQAAVVLFGQAPRLLAEATPAPPMAAAAGPAPAPPAAPAPADQPAQPAAASPATVAPPAPQAPLPSQASPPPPAAADRGPEPRLPWRVRESAGGLNLRLDLPAGALPRLAVEPGPVVVVEAAGLAAQPGWPLQQPGEGKPLQGLKVTPGARDSLRLRLELAPGQYTLLQHLDAASGAYHLDLFPQGRAEP